MFESSFFTSEDYIIDMSRIESIIVIDSCAKVTIYSKNTISFDCKSNQYQNFIKKFKDFKRIRLNL